MITVMRIDLHTHSSASDGTDTPAGLLAGAAAAGLDVVALTDHDTVGGYAAAAAARPAGLTVVPGAEISAFRGRGMHLLAYLFDPAEPAFAALRDRIRDDRVHRARAMVDRVRALGAPITWDRVEELAAGGAVGRPHVARALVEQGVVPDVSGAFVPEWLATGGRAYVRKYAADPVETVRLVRAAGGVPVLAHPRRGGRDHHVPDALVEELAAAGLAGLEVDHPDHDGADRRHLAGLARGLGLLATGASDYHGTNKATAIGAETTAPAVYEALVAAATGARPWTG